MPDTLFRLIWFSEIQWDFLSTRKQRILGRFPENWRILFIEPSQKRAGVGRQCALFKECPLQDRAIA